MHTPDDEIGHAQTMPTPRRDMGGDTLRGPLRACAPCVHRSARCGETCLRRGPLRSGITRVRARADAGKNRTAPVMASACGRIGNRTWTSKMSASLPHRVPTTGSSTARPPNGSEHPWGSSPTWPLKATRVLDSLVRTMPWSVDAEAVLLGAAEGGIIDTAL